MPPHPPAPPRPTSAELQGATRKILQDLIAPGLRVLFCGINPGLYSGATGHHFARPGNRFWPALHAGGFTPRVLKPWEEAELLMHGCGITNVVERTTTAAAELLAEEYVVGAAKLRKKVLKYRPRVLAIVGIGAYRTGFAQPKARLGLQAETIGSTLIWVLPSPSGLNAHHSPAMLGRLFREMNDAIGP